MHGAHIAAPCLTATDSFAKNAIVKKNPGSNLCGPEDASTSYSKTFHQCPASTLQVLVNSLLWMFVRHCSLICVSSCSILLSSSLSWWRLCSETFFGLWQAFRWLGMWKSAVVTVVLTLQRTRTSRCRGAMRGVGTRHMSIEREGKDEWKQHFLLILAIYQYFHPARMLL